MPKSRQVSLTTLFIVLVFASSVWSVLWLDLPIDLPLYPNHLRSPQAPLGISLNSTQEAGLAINESVHLGPWYNLLRQLQGEEKKHLHIVTLGGSMTTGQMDCLLCYDRRNRWNKCDLDGNEFGLTCAYPRYFQELLQQAYPKVSVKISNLAVRGCDSQCILSTRVREMIALQQEHHIDVVTLHMSSNDLTRFIGNPFESLVRFLLKLHPTIVVIVIQMLHATSYHPPITRHYHLPVIFVDEYANTSAQPYFGGTPPWDILAYGQNWMPLWVDHGFHPEWPYHRALAQFLYSVWAIHSDRAASATPATLAMKPLPPRLVPSYFINQVCYDVKMDLFNDTWVGHYTEEGGWIVGEDVRGKPGLWVDNINGAVVKIKMPVRRNLPIIGFSYLRSPQKMGIAEIFFEGEEERRIVINARDPTQWPTITIYKALCVSSPAHHAFVLPSCSYNHSIEHRRLDSHLFTKKTLVVRLLPAANTSSTENKFKLIQLLSC